MTERKHKPTVPKDELQRPFIGPEGRDHPPVMTPQQLAEQARLRAQEPTA